MRCCGRTLDPRIEGHYLAPVAFELSLDALPRIEIFCPILHVCTYRQSDLDVVLAWIRATGYGLTLGIHSRIQGFDEVVRASRVGNVYVNRSMIGAVGRPAAVRRRRTVRHRTQSRRSALSPARRHRTHGKY